MDDRPGGGWASRSGLALVLVAILVATLTPGNATAIGVSPWCLLCGDRALADALRNVLLFFPLGVLLRLNGRPPGRAVAAAALLSLGVELAQVVIPGRDASVMDVACNTLGAWLGAWLAGAPYAVLTPNRKQAAVLALSWAVIVFGVVAAGSSLARPSFPVSPYYGQWVPQLGSFSWYGGTVQRVRLGPRVLGDGPLAASPAVRAALLAGDTLVVEAIAGPPPRALAPVFSIADDRGREIVLVGADGVDLVFRYRNRATWWRLEEPGTRLPGAFREIQGGAAFTVRAWQFGPRVCLEVNGRRACRSPNPFHGWAFIVPESWLGPAGGRLATVGWVGCLVLPACYWLALALRRAR